MPAHTISRLSSLSHTLLVPLYFRAVESQRPDALIRDPKAVELVGQLDYDFSASMYRSQEEQVNVMLRTREFDRSARAFLDEHPEGVVVEMGCGLDTRFERVDNGRAEWYELDLPEVIALRRELLDETPRRHFVACSVLDFSWMDALSSHASRPFLFVTEGLLVYFEEAQVKGLLQRLRERFPGAEIVLDALSPFIVRVHPPPPGGARPRWGLKDDRDVEGWAPGIRLLGQWYYFDKPEPRLGPARLMRYIPLVGKAARVVRYRLGEPR